MRTAAILLMALGVLNAQDAIAPGNYRGTWTGASGSGDFHMTLKPDGAGSMTADIGFTIEGNEVPSKILSLKVDGTSIAFVYEFDLQGNKLQSSAQGKLKGKSFEGAYKTTAADSPVDEGTWKAVIQ